VTTSTPPGLESGNDDKETSPRAADRCGGGYKADASHAAEAARPDDAEEADEEIEVTEEINDPRYSRIVGGVPVLSDAEQFKLVDYCANEIGKVMKRFDHMVPFVRIASSKDRG
jgi:hypothetical protein